MTKPIRTKEALPANLEERQRKDLVLYSPVNCAKHSHKIKTVRDVFRLPSKTLGEFNRAYGREWVIGYISMWLIDLNDQVNVKTKMTDGQMEFTAERIYDSYSLKVTDLTLFFRNIKSGKYGQFYESLGPEKILEWLDLYYDERCEMAQLDNSRSHDAFSMSKDKVDPEVAKAMFDGVGENKVVFKHKGNGMGHRFKEVVKKELIDEIKSSSIEELREYLVKNDVKSASYNEFIYKLVESALDSKLKNQKPQNHGRK